MFYFNFIILVFFLSPYFGGNCSHSFQVIYSRLIHTINTNKTILEEKKHAHVHTEEKYICNVNYLKISFIFLNQHGALFARQTAGTLFGIFRGEEHKEKDQKESKEKKFKSEESSNLYLPLIHLLTGNLKLIGVYSLF